MASLAAFSRELSQPLQRGLFPCDNSTTALSPPQLCLELLRIVSYERAVTKVMHVSRSPFHLHWPARSLFLARQPTAVTAKAEKTLEGAPAMWTRQCHVCTELPHRSVTSFPLLISHISIWNLRPTVCSSARVTSSLQVL